MSPQAMEKKNFRYPRTTLVLQVTCTRSDEADKDEMKEIMYEIRGSWGSYCKINLDKPYKLDTSDDKWIPKLPSRPCCGVHGFDGEAFRFGCDNVYGDVVRRLLPGGSITSEHDFETQKDKNKNNKRIKRLNNKGKGETLPTNLLSHHATLTISWPEWKKDEYAVSIEQMLKEIVEKTELVKTDKYSGNPLDAETCEIEVQLAFGMEEPEPLRIYPMTQWPQVFLDAYKADPHMLDGFSFVRIQPVWVGNVTYRHSDDYMDAAEGYGCDVERETTVKERRLVGNVLEFDLKTTT